MVAETSSNGSRDRFSHYPMMPANVRPGQVIGLVEVTGGLGPDIDVSKLADELGADIAVLLPILDAAEMLGLVKSKKGKVVLTEFGHEFQKTLKLKARLLRDRLPEMEPFRTAIELASRTGEVETKDIIQELETEGITWHHQKELNAELVQSLLLHWTISSGLLAYDGRTGKFRKLH